MNTEELTALKEILELAGGDAKFIVFMIVAKELIRTLIVMVGLPFIFWFIARAAIKIMNRISDTQQLLKELGVNGIYEASKYDVDIALSKVRRWKMQDAGAKPQKP